MGARVLSPSGPARRRRAATTATAVAIALALVTAGCSSGSSGTSGSSGAGGSTPGSTAAAPPATTRPVRSPGCDADPATVAARSSHERVDLTTADGGRWYNRYVPAGYDGSPAPLVVDLHGYLSGAAGGSAMSNFAPVAEQAGFVLATPQGNSDKAYWNAVPHDGLPDDLAFLEQVMDDVEQDVCIDPARVYVAGFSNGAFLASLVACRLPDRVAAVAAVAGLQRPADCAPDRAVPLLGIHGTADGYVGFDGSPGPRLDELAWNDDSRAAFEGLPWAPVTDAAAAWATAEGCGPEATRTTVATGIERRAYTGCRDGSTVELYVVDGAGHTWPGSAFATASASILGPTNQEMDASQVIWDFFAAHPMPGAGEAADAGKAATATPASLPPAVQSLEIVGTEYTFALTPTGTLQPGWTRVTFHNRGGEAHQVMFAALKPGVDLTELAAAAGGDSSGSKAIEYVDMLGGVSYVGPGQTVEAMVELPTGMVMAMCYVPDATGKAHALSGMSTMLTVAAADAAGSAAAPTTTASSEPVRGTIVMDRDGYRLPDELPTGWYQVVNRDGGTGPGQGLHELSILGLERELSADGLQGLLDDLAVNATPEMPLVALGGMGALSAGFEGYLYLDLEDGPYLAVDFMPDPGDPRPHLLDGYATPFRV